MDAGNSSFGRGEVQEARDPHSDSSSDDELPRNLVVQQGINSVGEEAASNIVGGGTGPLGSTSTPADSTPADSGDSGSNMSRRRSWRYRGTPLTLADWKIGFEFMKFLKVFYVATVACSGVRYPTSCIVVNNIYNISLNFLNHKEQPNLVSACIDMEGKFRKYYEEMPPIYLLAAVMDPRIKLEDVSLLLSGIGTNLGITTLPSSAFVNDLLTIISSLGIGSSNVTSRVELSKYLELESVSANDRINFDILAWWEKNEEKYPILSIMARDLLTPPVSSVASESAFSAGKRVLDERRSRLAPDILDCLICLKDWEDARLGIEKRSAKDEFRGYFADSDIESD
ncbi:hypothetical protein RHSIM_Rhsim11G0003000 [Rhododendron simsii]|uniref:HAT C-terminal dimerisation domain-containing protein n=1 Tax=Rhododendron simsii TaxID=118357 RepID=A0A834LB82_RHOSS|nr:hypothetical protein RHSIM_Rhsim11G0003000 [Rhododendron simsii]